MKNWFDEEKIAAAIGYAFGETMRDPIVVALGYKDEDGNEFIYVEADDGEQNKYYFHELPGYPPFVGEAYAYGGVIPAEYLKYGMPIRIKVDPLSSATPRFFVQGLDPVLSGNYAQTNPRKDSRTYIQTDQFIAGSITPTDPPSMIVRFRGAPFTYNGEFFYWKSKNSDEFGVDAEDTLTNPITLPTTATNDKFVLVQVSMTDGALSYKVGDLFSSALSNASAFELQINTGDNIFPNPDAGHFRSGYIRLKYGQTAITKSSIWSVQEFYTIVNAATSTALGGTGSDLSAEGPGFLHLASNGTNVTILKHNLTATTDPTVDEDTADGYAPGSMWVNLTLDKVFLCADNGAGAAVWLQVAGGGSMSSFLAGADSGTPEAISDGQTLTIAGGTGISTVVGATDTVTINLDTPVAVSSGGTGADLSASGGANHFVKMSSLGGPMSAGTISSAEITTALTTPPAIGGTIPAAGTFTTVNGTTGTFTTLTGTTLIATQRRIAASTELTISAGAVTKTQSYHRIDTEADAASDSLDTISGGTSGDELFIRAENTARTVSITNAGNIYTGTGTDIDLDSNEKIVHFIYDGTLSKWVVVGGSGGVGGGGTNFNITGDTGTPETVGDADTVTIAGGTGISTVVSATNTVTVNLDVPVAITDGGTGETTATAAFNAISPNTTKGDIIVHNGTNNIRVPVGATDGHALVVDAAEAAGVKWAEVSGTGGGGTGGILISDAEIKVLLDSGTLGSAGTFTMTGFSADYKDLIIRARIRSTATGAGAGDQIYLLFNGDTTAANYHSQRGGGYDNTASNAELANPTAALVPGTSAVTGSFAWIEIVIPDYTSTTLRKQAYVRQTEESAADTMAVLIHMVHWDNTAAITQIDIVTDNDPTDLLEVGSTYSLYGVTESDVSGFLIGGTTIDNVLIETLEQELLLASSGQLDISSISQDGLELICYAKLRGAAAVNYDTLNIFLNGDYTATNYYSQRQISQNATPDDTETNSPDGGDFPGGSATSGKFGSIIIRIPEYSIIGEKKIYVTTFGSRIDGNISMGETVITWTGTSPINQITLRPDGYATDLFSSGSEIKVYRKKLTDIGGGGTGTEYVPNAMVHELLYSSTLTGTGRFLYSAIPQTYDDLYIKLRVRTSQVTTVDSPYIYFSGDETATNYHSQRTAGSNNSAQAFEYNAPILGTAAGTTSPAGEYSLYEIWIRDYSSTVFRKLAIANYTTEYDAAAMQTGTHGVLWESKNAITSVAIQPDGYPTDGFLSGSYMEVYGVKKRDIGATAASAGIESVRVEQLITSGVLESANRIDIQNITGDYDDLRLKLRLRGTGAAVDPVYIRFNGDVGANYHQQIGGGYNNAASYSETTNPTITFIPGSTSPASAFAYAEIIIPDYSNTAFRKVAYTESVAEQSDAGQAVWQTMLTWKSTAAITQITLQPDGYATDNFAIGSMYELYGIKRRDIGSGSGNADDIVYTPSNTDNWTVPAPETVQEALDLIAANGLEGGEVVENVLTKVLISSSTLSSAGTFDFTGISAEYDHLFLVGRLRSDVVSTVDLAYTYLNGDTTTTNYHYQQIMGANNTTSGGEGNNPRTIHICGDTSPVGTYTYFEIMIPDYANTSMRKLLHVNFSNENEWGRLQSGQLMSGWNDTAAINRIRIQPDTSPTNLFMAGSYVELYGVKKVDLGRAAGSADTIDNVQTRVLLYEEELSAPGVFDVSGISQDYDELYIDLKERTTSAVQSDGTYLMFNGDYTIGNYAYQRDGANNGSSNTAQAGSPSLPGAPGATAVAGIFANTQIYIQDYADSTTVKSYTSYNGFVYATTVTGAARWVGAHYTVWNNTNAITQITIRPDGYPTDNFDTGSRIRIWGVKTSNLGVGAKTTAEYVTTAEDSTLPNSVVIPGLAGSADRNGLAGTDFALEFDTTTSGLTWTPSAPDAYDSNITAPSHYYIRKASTTEQFAFAAYTPAGAFDARMKVSIGRHQTSATVTNIGLILADAGNTNRLLNEIIINSVTPQLRAWSYASSTWTQRGSTINAANYIVYLRIVRDASTNIDWMFSYDGLAWILLTELSFSFTPTQIGIRLATNTTNEYTGFVDWIRATG